MISFEDIEQLNIKHNYHLDFPLAKRKIAMLVPAHNEEVVIEETLRSLLDLVSAEDIFVVDDGSHDNTAVVAKRLVPNVLSLNPNKGKADAMNAAISHFQIYKNYEYIMPMDADTKVSKNFLEHTLPILEKDKHKKICAVVGKVVGKDRSWVTTYRQWEYEIAQTIHKSAQSSEGAIIVCPGCATVYRASIFENLRIPRGTLAEDMDFTFLLHRKKLGKIVYSGKAIVVTQDPISLKDLVKQVDRWYTGFWQCVVKHDIPWGGQIIDAEVALLATEGIFNGVLVISLFFLIPFALINHPNVLLIPLVADIVFFLLPTMLLTAIKHKNWKIFLYVFHFYVIRLISCLIFFKSFIKMIFGLDIKTGWNKALRYKI